MTRSASEHGATMVEFALSSLVLVFLFGALFDVGLGVHNYTLLKHVTAEATREIAVRMQTNTSCTAAQAFLDGQTTERLVKTLGADGDPQWNLCWTNTGVALGSTGSYPVMRVSGEVSLHCYFLCSVMPNGIMLRTSSEIVIERGSAAAPCITADTLCS